VSCAASRCDAASAGDVGLDRDVVLVVVFNVVALAEGSVENSV